VTLAAALAAALQSGYAAWREHRTIDEPMHLQWARRLLETGETERESQYMYNSKTPGTLPQVLATRAAERLGVESGRALRFAGRLATVAMLAALLWTVFAAGRALFGERAGLLATLGAALDPNLIAHGSLSTLDLAFALATLLSAWAAIRFAARPGLVSGTWLGAAVGLALAVKFSAVLIVPGLAFLPLARGRESPPTRLRSWLAGLAATTILACAVLCAAYLFHGVGRTLGAVRWQSEPFQKAAGLLPWLPLPVPAGFLTGIDTSFQHERASYDVVILDQLHVNGVWYYFGLLWLLKTPVLLLIATVAGLLLGIRPGWLGRPGARFVAAQVALFLAYFSFLFHAQLGYRFVLMCLPLGYLLAARGIAGLPVRADLRGLGWLVVIGSLVETGVYLGNPLSFTNMAVQPKTKVYRWITDSNLDWGQNGDEIEAWRGRPELARAHWEPPHAVAGTNVFSARTLTTGSGFERHRWLRTHVEPAEHLGHTHLVFDLDADLFNRLLDEGRRHEATRSPAPQCPRAEELSAWPAEGLTLAAADDAGDEILCVFTDRPSNVRLEVASGSATVGDCESSAEGRERAEAGQSVWFRLDPGFHRLCARRLDDGDGRVGEARWRAVTGTPLAALVRPR
jgi:hypothetical protein